VRDDDRALLINCLLFDFACCHLAAIYPPPPSVIRLVLICSYRTYVQYEVRSRTQLLPGRKLRRSSSYLPTTTRHVTSVHTTSLNINLVHVRIRVQVNNVQIHLELHPYFSFPTKLNFASLPKLNHILHSQNH
jgi:hypothetical protein